VWYTTEFSTHKISIIFKIPASPSATASNSQSQGGLSLLQVVYGMLVAIAVVTVVTVALQLIIKDRRAKPRQRPRSNFTVLHL
jgi:hypothetical protein